ncbi:ACP S-malonyltransferase [Streptomyces atroolivaceus]|uniref:ACP S-malonyltransferase n=1 Tax=Streptomyces atroolivaceus TaxID=66869 RepID=UPI002025B0B9|nr:ACP S-malonyltransferase [Streptomyces atroolivaceus]
MESKSQQVEETGGVPDGVTGIIFPGMGPQDFSVSGKFLLIDPVASEMLAEASDTVGYDVFARYKDSTSDYSEEAQIAFLVVCLALARWAETTQGVSPQFCAGPSFGGKGAAVYSGALAFGDAVRLTSRLARYEAAFFTEECPGIVTHSFARTPRAVLDTISAELTASGEWHEISCHIDDDFYMLSLRDERLEWFQKRLRAEGGMPLYTMDPPMHASLFAPLRDKVEAELFGELRFADPRIPVVADQDGSVRTTADGVRGMLLDGFVKPVVWPAVVDTLLRSGVRDLCVAGPDSLFSRVPRTTRNFRVDQIGPRSVLQPRPTRA